ncbi:MAG: Ig-like domain-containing protein [Thermodesulfobacteriota bacterium]
MKRTITPQAQVGKGLGRAIATGLLAVLVPLALTGLAWPAPAVLDRSPAPGAVVELDAVVTATFSEDMDPAPLTTGSVRLSQWVGIKAIAAGYGHTVALREDGTVVAWGDNGYGQTTVPSSPYETPIPATVAYDANSRTVTLTTEAPRPGGVTIMATVTTGVQNLTGVPGRGP